MTTTNTLCTCTTGTRCDDCAADLTLLTSAVRVIETVETTAHADWWAMIENGPILAGDRGTGNFRAGIIVWERGYHHGADFGVSVTAYDAGLTMWCRLSDPVPAWVPRPPEGWDAGVDAVIAALR